MGQMAAHSETRPPPNLALGLCVRGAWAHSWGSRVHIARLASGDTRDGRLVGEDYGAPLVYAPMAALTSSFQLLNSLRHAFEWLLLVYVWSHPNGLQLPTYGGQGHGPLEPRTEELLGLGRVLDFVPL